MSNPFQQLRWKLTLRYTAVTVAALLAVELVVISGLASHVARESRIAPEELLKELDTTYVPIARRFLSRIPPDVDGLREHLAPLGVAEIDIEPIQLGDFMLNVSSTNTLFVFFVNSDGRLIDSLPHGYLERTGAGEVLDPDEIPGLREPLAAAMEGMLDTEALITQLPGNPTVGAIPIFDEKEEYRIVGALAFMRRTQFWEVITLANMARQLGFGLLVITLFAGVMGAVFGFLTARGLVRRLKTLLDSAQAWSQGDFSVRVDDRSGDELGRLSHGLNIMAVKLGSLMEQRQQMSVIEERNRLARDLHDSVKQRTFAASAQLGAARARIKASPPEAETHLAEAEKLLNKVRHELTDLIRELLPVALQGKGLVAAVREHALDCANQTDIDVQVRIQNERELPAEVEQALFHIFQGALSNVARHSQADHAEVWLIYGTSSITLTVADNGRGFDVGKKHAGLGLRVMRERAESLGGFLIVENGQSNGTKVTVTCPH
ncbi:MAG: sensor histidine kinase [Anaerolineales bacterium]|jgi:NarL family two-component system sensor histidine kinase LiaS